MIVLGLTALSALSQISPVRAADTLVITPTRTQEGNLPGITFTLIVRGAVVGQSYQFYWAVVDPSGMNFTTTTSTVASSSSFTLSRVYPRDFSAGAGLTHAGQYSTAVFQTAPSVALMGAGQFTIGLTDKIFYERTGTVLIKAAGYVANDNVTISITKAGNFVPGFPLNVRADSTGNVAATWPTAMTTATGNYTVSLQGATTTPKSPPDTQWFVLIPAAVAVTPNATFAPSSILSISVKATNPDGTPFTNGDVSGQWSTSAGTIGAPVRLSFEQSQAKWIGTYQVNSNDPSGLWKLQVTASDSNGNNGQGSTSLSVIAPAPPPPPPPSVLSVFTSIWFLALIAAITIFVVEAILILRQKRVLPPNLRVNPKAVELEAQRLMDNDFFRSIQSQMSQKIDSKEEEPHG